MIPYEKFETLAREFATLSESIDDEWQLKKFKTSKNEVYLEKKVHFNINANINEVTDSFSTFLYHIIYSSSYNVPVLYFNAHHINGKLLTLDEIWKQVPVCYNESSKDMWSVITQSEHPKLGIPFFMVHPCHTADLMSNIITNSDNYLISWLSVVGPLIGLRLSLNYAKYLKS